MSIACQCPSCGSKIKAPDQLAGKSAKCPHCNQLMRIPSSEAVNLVPASTAVSQPNAQRPCPFCAELVQAEAKKCRHCGEILDAALRAADESSRAASRRSRNDDDDRPRSSAAAAAANTTVVNILGGHQPFNHTLHLLLTVFTCGCWFPIWIIAYALHK